MWNLTLLIYLPYHVMRNKALRRWGWRGAFKHLTIIENEVLGIIWRLF